MIMSLGSLKLFWAHINRVNTQIKVINYRNEPVKLKMLKACPVTTSKNIYLHTLTDQEEVFIEVHVLVCVSHQFKRCACSCSAVLTLCLLRNTVQSSEE